MQKMPQLPSVNYGHLSPCGKKPEEALTRAPMRTKAREGVGGRLPEPTKTEHSSPLFS